MNETRPILPRTYDIIIYGATGFTGQQCIQYLLEHAPSELRWAITGRNEKRLEALAKKHQRPWLYADAEDLESIDLLCAQTRIVLSTVDPLPCIVMRLLLPVFNTKLTM